MGKVRKGLCGPDRQFRGGAPGCSTGHTAQTWWTDRRGRSLPAGPGEKALGGGEEPWKAGPPASRKHSLPGHPEPPPLCTASPVPWEMKQGREWAGKGYNYIDRGVVCLDGQMEDEFEGEVLRLKGRRAEEQKEKVTVSNRQAALQVKFTKALQVAS